MPLTENQIMLTATGACSSKVSAITGSEFFFIYANRSLRERGHIFTLPMAEKGRSFSLYFILSTWNCKAFRWLCYVFIMKKEQRSLYIQLNFHDNWQTNINNYCKIATVLKRSVIGQTELTTTPQYTQAYVARVGSASLFTKQTATFASAKKYSQENTAKWVRTLKARQSSSSSSRRSCSSSSS